MRKPPEALRSVSAGWTTVAACLGMMAIFSASPALAADLFGPAPSSLAVGRFVESLAVADFNRDGSMDVAAASRVSDSVTVLLGDGLGGFLRASEFTVGSDPIFIVAADFNGDDAADLAVTRTDGDAVQVWLGNGLGGFAHTSDFLAGPGPARMAPGDFDGNGTIDLAVSNYDGDSVSIFLGDGFGGFVESAEIAVGDGPASLVVADLNKDGIADVAVANSQGGSVSVLLGDGLGGFMRAPDFSHTQTLSLAAADFNRDGVIDLVAGEHSNESVVVLLGDGLGGFSRTEGLEIDGAPVSIGVADFNRDGSPDVIAASGPNRALVLLQGNGLGGFERRVDVAFDYPGAIAVGDFNRDGDADVAVGSAVSSAVTVFTGDGFGNVVQNVEIAVGLFPTWVISADFDRDGAPDLAIVNHGSDAARCCGSVSVLLGDGFGGVARITEYPQGLVGRNPWRLVAEDFDGDRVLDLAVVANGQVRMLRGDGSGGFALSGQFTAGRDPRGAVAADFDGDGTADLAVANRQDGTVSILLGDGHGGFTRTPDVGVGDGPTSVVAADFDGDGDTDLAVVNTGSDSVSLLQNDGSGSFVEVREVGVGYSPLGIVSTDFNQDGKEDLAVAIEGDHVVNVLLGDGLGGFVQSDAIDVGDYPKSIVAEDFNRDGAADLAVVNSGSASVSVLLGDGSGGFIRTTDLGVAGFPIGIAVSDFRHDGAPDLVVTQFTRDSFSLLYNQLPLRADTNGSNRIDGFDIVGVGRSMGARLAACSTTTGCSYRRQVDVDLNGVIDGDDLAAVATRFGQTNRSSSPLRPTFDSSATPDAHTVTLREVSSDGDLLTMQVLVNDADDFVAAADLAVTFEPAPGDGGEGQVLEYVGFEPGSYLSGGVTQLYGVNSRTPGRVEVSVTRLPNEARRGAALQPLLNLLFRARREGQATLDFAPSGQASPSLLDAHGLSVPGIQFVGGETVRVDTSAQGPSGQRIGLGPDAVEFGVVEIGASARQMLRISNFGFSDLEVSRVTATVSEFISSFSSALIVPPFAFVELPIGFSPTRDGTFGGEIVVECNDARHPETRVPVHGSTDRGLTAVPTRIDFGRATVGSTVARPVRIGNRGQAPLILTGFSTSDARFTARVEFSVLAPGESRFVWVDFRPGAEETAHGWLELFFDAPATKTVVLSLQGEGR